MLFHRISIRSRLKIAGTLSLPVYWIPSISTLNYHIYNKNSFENTGSIVSVTTIAGAFEFYEGEKNNGNAYEIFIPSWFGFVISRLF